MANIQDFLGIKDIYIYIDLSFKRLFFTCPSSEITEKNIAKGTTDPRVEFILSKYLLEVIS